MEFWELIFLPAVGALIGWLTNMLAIRMLFRPREPVKLPLLPWTLQGLLPKRRRELAENAAAILDNDLLPIDELVRRAEDMGYEQHLLTEIVSHVDQRLETSLPHWIPFRVRIAARDYVQEVVAKESRTLILRASESTLEKLKKEARLGSLIEEKINALDLVDLEKMVLRLARQELRHIEYLGALLGGVIGLLQAVFVLWRM